MKRKIALWILVVASIIVSEGCSMDSSTGGRGNNASFTNAEMYYYNDDILEGVGSYGISLYDSENYRVEGKSYTELYLDFASTHFENNLDAIPAEGVYTFSDDFTEFTFNNDYSRYIMWNGRTERQLGIMDGQFSLTRIASGYSLQFDLLLGDDTRLRGKYEGPIVYVTERSSTPAGK
jgi:hypothetical protein